MESTKNQNHIFKNAKMSNKQNEKGQGTDLHHILMLTKRIV